MTPRPWMLVPLLLCPLLAIAAEPAPPPPAAPPRSAPPPPPEINATAYVLMDFDTGDILAEKNIDEKRPPASLTKIMTSYIAAREIDSGRIHLTDDVPISVNAWKHAAPEERQSAMFIREGTTVKLEDLLRGVIIQSGNDATVAVAEYIGGSEDAFVNLMNQEAKKLGMFGTNFVNSDGLPDPNHYSTVRDLATLARALIRDHPTHYAIYAEKSFRYNNIDQPNRNRLLWRDRTVDGVKTGHTAEAGFCLIASALRDGMRLVSVVMGTDSDEARMRESQKLLSYGYRFFETHKLYEPGVMLRTAEVWYGEENEVQLGVSAPVYVTIPRGRYGDLKAETDVERVIRAPIAVGDPFGELRVSLDDKVVVKVPLTAQNAIAEAGFFKRLWHSIYLFFRELLS
ncbi:MAG TPA: D-alanyl-D-alanine carboxypeptidase family protein [Pseudomonadales bacterium]